MSRRHLALRRLCLLTSIALLTCSCNSRPQASVASPLPSPDPPQATPSSPPLAKETPSSGNLRSEGEKDFANLEAQSEPPDIKQLEAPQTTQKLVGQGKDLYFENCATCHHPNFPSDHAPQLDPPPNDLRDLQTYRHGKDAGAFFKASYYGIEGTGMAPFGDILEPRQIWAIYYYLQSQKNS